MHYIVFVFMTKLTSADQHEELYVGERIWWCTRAYVGGNCGS